MEELGIAKKRECKWCKRTTLKCIGRQRKNGNAHYDDWDRDLHVNPLLPTGLYKGPNHCRCCSFLIQRISSCLAPI